MGKDDKRRHFTGEFKRNAVQLVTEKGMPVGKVARELDIHPNLLHPWRRRLLKDGDKAFVGKACKAGGSRNKAAPEGIRKGKRREEHF